MENNNRLLSFGAYTFDPNNGELQCGNQKQDLTPKDSNVLNCLLNQHGALVTKDQLFSEVWGNQAISDGVLKASIKRIRRVLGDSYKSPKYIETVRSRGYRFLLPVKYLDRESRQQEATSSKSLLLSETTDEFNPIIGRDGVIKSLNKRLQSVLNYESHTLFITGPAGIGKSFLIDKFIQLVPYDIDAVIAKGHCINDPISKEAYFPILTAINELITKIDNGFAESSLRRVAPMWLTQFPWLLDEHELSSFQKNLQGVAASRMLRELSAFLETIAQKYLVILILEDLHWSDHSTLAAINHLVKTTKNSKLLILSAFRPLEGNEIKVINYFSEQLVKREIEKIELKPFSRSDIKRYLSFKGSGNVDKTLLANWLYKNTEGLPLFVINLYKFIENNGWLSAKDLFVELAFSGERFKRHIPENLRTLIQQQIEQLPNLEKSLLKIASVFGEKFNVSFINHLLSESFDELVKTSENLIKKHGLLKQSGLIRSSNGSLDTVYSFAHSWFQKVAYELIPAIEVTEYHHRAGHHLENVFSNNVGKVAPALATHFEKSNHLQKAVSYRKIASQTALGRHAIEDSIEHINHGLRLINESSREINTDRSELDLQTLLGTALVATKGYAHPSVEKAYTRAHSLCLEVEENVSLLPILYGLCMYYMVKGDFQSGDKLRELFLNIATRGKCPEEMLCWGYALFCMTSWYQGDHIESSNFADLAIEHYDPQDHQNFVQIYGVDAGIACLLHKSLSYWVMGFPSEASSEMVNTIALAEKYANPFMQAWVFCFAGWLSTFFSQFVKAGEYAKKSIALSHKHGIEYWNIQASILNCWAETKIGNDQDTASKIGDFISKHKLTGTNLITSKFLMIQADCYELEGNTDEALHCIDNALKIVETYNEKWWESELLRYKAELTIKRFGETAYTNPSNKELINSTYDKSVKLSKNQYAKSLELRSTLSWANFMVRVGRQENARKSVSDIYNWFENRDQTHDTQQAEIFLDQFK